MELVNLVRYLVSMQYEEQLYREFRFCDHVTSVMNIGECAARSEEVASKEREAEIAVILKSWTSAQKIAFMELRAAADDFISSRAGEVDGSGLESGLEFMGMAARFREEFIEIIRKFELGQLPADKDFKGADKELNESYSTIMRMKNLDGFGTVTKDGIRAAQRKWMKYRDAWTKFAGVKYPGTVSDVFKVWLAQKRTEQLKEFVQ